MNITEKALSLCHAIEAAGASEPLTKCSVLAAELHSALQREDAIADNTIAQRDAAEEAADKLASAVLGEPIDWSDHSAKWAEALEKAQAEKARVEGLAAKMKAFVAENYPPNDKGQVDFARALVEGYAAELLGQDA